MWGRHFYGGKENGGLDYHEQVEFLGFSVLRNYEDSNVREVSE